MLTKNSILYPEIEKKITRLNPLDIPKQRQASLKPLIEFIQAKISEKQVIRVHFICTHNSRRSHLAQVWAQTLAYYLGIENFVSFSGGTETTALYPMVTENLKDLGFQIQQLSEDENPLYAIKYAENEHPIIGFSKKIEDDFNPKSAFAAIITCDSANEACPFVAGAEKRIPITYEDPKAYDNTPQQAENYRERSLQIATELLYAFSEIKS